MLEKASFKLQINWGLIGFVFGIFALSLVTCAAWFAGLPLLGHSLAVEWLIFAGVLTAALVWWINSVWHNIGFPARVSVGVVIAVSVLFLGVGIVANPVVVDGVVYVKGSQTYKEVAYASGLAEDLLTLGSMDRFLSDSTAEAWNQSKDIEKAQIESAEISAKYGKTVQAREIPAGALGPPTTSTMAAAYEMSKALEFRLSLLELGTDKEITELQDRRTSFVNTWKQAGQELGSAAEELNIPLNVDGGPREA